MLIDWFTVIAQVINFIILVFLLQRFLYRPIVETITSRQEQVDRRWQEAEEQKAIAELEAATYQKQQQQLEQEKRNIIAQTQEQADREYHNLIEQVRREVDRQKASWENEIASQQEKFFENLQEKVTEKVHQIARQALQELADSQLEQKAIAAFIHCLETLDEQKRQSLTQSLRQSDNGLVIRSSFELPPESRKELVNSLHQQQICEGQNLRFDTNPDLIFGIELQATNYRISWNLKSYLQSLEQNLARDFPKNIINN